MEFVRGVCGNLNLGMRFPSYSALPQNFFRSQNALEMQNSTTFFIIMPSLMALRPQGRQKRSMLRATCSANVIIFSYFYFLSGTVSHPIISGCTWPIFITFSPNGRHLVVYYSSDLFSIVQETLPWEPILGAKLAKSAYSHSVVTLTFRNGLEYCNADVHVNSNMKIWWSSNWVYEGHQSTPLVDQHWS